REEVLNCLKTSLLTNERSARSFGVGQARWRFWAAPPAGPRQSGALAPHSTTLARSAEYHAESPKFWSAPRQRRFPTAVGEKGEGAAPRDTVSSTAVSGPAQSGPCRARRSA